MKIRTFIFCLMFVFMAEAAAAVFFAVWDTKNIQDAVAVNEAVYSVQEDWEAIESHKSHTGLDYVVLDLDGNVQFQTKPELSISINQAVIHRDTILDLNVNGAVVGKIIIYNDSLQMFRKQKQTILMILAAAMLVKCVICMGYMFYLNDRIVRPFRKLKGFAERIADGNLEVPLEMDRKNIFGAFTESFDIMRAELKKARQAEAEANASKKELVAELSHDMKTPVASIKAAAEVGAALAESEKIRENYIQIIRKADQINTLITNLFTASLEELKQLSVTLKDFESGEVKQLLENADYLHRAKIPKIPDCIVYADKFRLQQVFDNIFANSYKYADTPIRLWAALSDRQLILDVEDFGGGVCKEELPLIKEKFKRGNNTQNVEGAGLGLYISDYFMKEMQGELIVENGEEGLKVTVKIALSGRM